jgi:hypothetical protein
VLEHPGVLEVLFVIHAKLVFPTPTQEIFPVLGSFLRTDQPRVVTDGLKLFFNDTYKLLGSF